ncbi:uncharacterized protein swt1 isoform X2 [Engraulis encrasicolus]|uniref:uncharacterized protein swt1 isoform X2 n=1 Tax=Engraulis encrasicolus TaxID=184585 RepID=UPI002FD72487
MSKSKRKKHKKSKQRTPSPESEQDKAGNQTKAASEKKKEEPKKEECHKNHQSPGKKRKGEERDRTFPQPQRLSSTIVCSPDTNRVLKKPVYRLSTPSAEKKGSRKVKGEEDTEQQHRTNEEKVAGKKRQASNTSATEASAKDSKSTPVSAERSRSRRQSHSTPSSAARKDGVPPSLERNSGSSIKAERSSTPSSTAKKDGAPTSQKRSAAGSEIKASPSTSSPSSSTVKNTSLDLQEERKKLVRRRSEGEDYEPAAKTSRSRPVSPSQPEELQEARKALVEKKRRRSVEQEVKAGVLSAEKEKGENGGMAQEDGERRRTSGNLSSASSKLTGSARPGFTASAPQRALGATAPVSTTTMDAAPKPQPMVNFRIPKKKPTAVLPQADIWKEADQSPADPTTSTTPLKPLRKPSTTPTTHQHLSTSEVLSTGPHESTSTTVPKQDTPASSKLLSTSGAGQPASSPKGLFIPRTVKPLKPATPPTGKPPEQHQKDVGKPKASRWDVCDPKTFRSDVRKPQESQADVCRPQKLQSDVHDGQKFHSGVCEPQNFQTEAESSVTPVRVPEQSLVMPPNTAIQPFVWNTQAAASSSSIILPENNHNMGDGDQEMQLLEELHQARCEHRLQVNVVESYGELTAMDIDPPEEGATSSPVLSKDLAQQELIIVLDTNILLSHLDVVKRIRSHGLGALGFPVLLIPWVVLQELDSIKNGKLNSSVGRRATPAVHYIYTCLKNQEQQLWGQSMQQASQALCGLQVENNDDRVLQCCLQYQKLCPKRGLILCTNDKNLCSKAVLSGVRALSKADLLQEVERLKPGVLSPSAVPTAAQHTACPSWQSEQKDVDRSKMDPKSPQGDSTVEQREAERAREQEREREREREMALARQLSECVCLLEDSLQRALSRILEQEMKQAYAELWTEIVMVKPPWSLHDVLQCVSKHWIAVFGSIVHRGLKSNITQLIECLCSDDTVDVECVCQAVAVAVDLLSGFSSRSDYGGVLTQTINTLQDIPHRLLPQAAGSPKAAVDDDSVMGDVEVAQPSAAQHADVWRLFQRMWDTVTQHSEAAFSTFGYVRGSMGTAPSIVGPPPSQDDLRTLHGLLTAVTQLLHTFQRLLSDDSSVNDAQSLITFIQTTEIAALEPHFTAQDLYDCLSQQEYRQKLCFGASQLSEVRDNLESCAAMVASRWG